MRSTLLQLAAVLLCVFSCRQAVAQDKAAGDKIRSIVLQRGHTEGASSLALSHDGKWLVTAGHGGQVKLWETATGREMRSFTGHLDLINDLCFSDDDQWLVTCSGDGLLKLDEANDRIGLADATVRLWNVTTGRQVRTFTGSNGRTTRVAFSHDGKWLATIGDHNEPVRLWNTATGKTLHYLRHGSTGEKNVFPTAMVFSRDDKRLFTADTGGRIRVWDVASGSMVREFKREEPAWIDGMGFGPDGKRLFTLELFRVNSDGQIVVWNAKTGEPDQTIQLKDASHCQFSPDCKSLFSVSRSAKRIEMWDLPTGKILRTFGLQEKYAKTAVSPDGKWLYATDSSTDGLNVCARTWNVADGKQLRVFAGLLQAINTVSISEDGTRLVTAGGNEFGEDDTTVQLWDLAIGKQTRVFKGHRATIYTVALSRDGKRLASGGIDATARFWDVDTGKQLGSFLGRLGSVTSVALSNDGKTLAAATGGSGVWTDNEATGFGTRCFSLDSHARKHFLAQIEGVFSVTFSEDGTRLATGGADKKVRLWDTASGKVVRVLEGHTSEMRCVRFSHDGTMVVSASCDGTARLWSTAIGEHLHTFKGHKGTIYGLAVSRDGKMLATAGGDRTVRLYDLTTKTLLRVFRGHDDGVVAVSFARDGNRMITGSLDGTTRIWNTSTGRQLCRLVSFSGGTWVVLDEAGNFDSNAEGDPTGVHWISAMQTSPLQSRVPGLLRRLLAE
jgi:WD40 repeat protein